MTERGLQPYRHPAAPAQPEPAPAPPLPAVSTDGWEPTAHGQVRPAVYERHWETLLRQEQAKAARQQAERQARAVRAPAEDRWPMWLQGLIFWGGLALIAGTIVTSLATGWFHFGVLSVGILRVVLKFS